MKNGSYLQPGGSVVEAGVKIVGGSSNTGKISILSDEFTATATFNGNGTITSDVRRHSLLSRFLYKHKHFPMPKLLRMLLFLADSMKTLGRIILAIVVCNMAVALTTLPWKTVPNQPTGSGFSDGLMIGIIIIIIMLFHTSKNISAWHGAEHMTIASYDRTGSTSIRFIARESPVHEKCGGRLLLPFIAIGFFSGFVADKTGINQLFIYPLLLECSLWIDSLIGWDKIPGTSLASRLLQKHITTRRPGKRELQTAQRAIRALINAHHSM